MITSLSGRVQEVNSDHLVIEIGGVGLQVFVPAPTRERVHVGETVFLHTYLVVRQDALTLFGFDNREGRELFTLLLGVNGIGPRLALAVLSTLSLDMIHSAVFHQQDEVFSRVPGVGRKTAQKILLHLQDRLPSMAGLKPLAVVGEVDTEVMNALTALGYSVVEAQAAIQSIPKDAPQEVEERLRLALRYFS